MLCNFAKLLFVEFRENFAQISISSFEKISRNSGKIFARHEINDFAKISQNYDNENFRSHPSVTI